MAFRVVGGVTAGTVLVVGSKPMTEVIFELLHGKLSFIAVVTKCAGTEGDLLAAQAHNMGGGGDSHSASRGRFGASNLAIPRPTCKFDDMLYILWYLVPPLGYW